MTSPLERAARAYHDNTRTFRYIRDCTNPGRPPVAKPMPFIEWNDLDDETKAERVNQARAVLTAIREPSEGMWDRAMQEGYDCDPSTYWRAMIDHALAEGATS